MIVGRRDTIAAIATPAGPGGVGIVRISGPRAIEFACVLLGRRPDEFPDRQLVNGLARDGDGRRLDRVLAVVMRAPRSFTGEDVAEIHGHGGVINMTRLLQAAVGAGARHAEAGEFTRRAFENGKLDLSQAEAVLEVIEASSERACRLAQAQLHGSIGQRIAAFRTRATTLLAEVEACIDFPEEGETFLDEYGVARRSRDLADELGELAGTFALGRAIRSGIEVAIVGPVNSGKSSIFNRLTGKLRSIVDSTPGTTRDFVEASVIWDGVPVTLIDTAGEREPGSRVEKQGIEMGRQRADEADLCLRTHSAEEPLPEPAAGGTEGAGQVLDVVTKGDLCTNLDTSLLVTSARTGAGLERLKRAILEAVCGVASEGSEGHVITSERQRALLSSAAAAFSRAADCVGSRSSIEIIAVEIRTGAQYLAEVLGESVGEEVLDELFARFCIGK